jgi:hypothetical protein
MWLVGMVEMAVVVVGSLAASVAAGMFLLAAALRVLEAAIPTAATAPAVAADVTDLAEYVRRTTGPLAAPAELERAA